MSAIESSMQQLANCSKRQVIYETYFTCGTKIILSKGSSEMEFETIVCYAVVLLPIRLKILRELIVVLS